MRSLPFAPLGLAVVLLGGCGAPRPAAAPSRDAPKKPAAGALRFDEAIGREVDPKTLKAMRVSALDGKFEGTVLAATPPKVLAETNDEGLTLASLEIPIGTAEPLRCSVSPGRADASRFFAHFTSAARTQKPIVSVVARPSGSVMFLTAAYTGKGGTGLVKLAVAPRAVGSLACIHDEVGYQASFERVFLSAIDGRAPAADPDAYVEVAQVSERKKPVGFVETRARATTEGGREAIESFVAVAEKGERRAFLEGVTVSKVDKKGELVEMTYVHLVDGVLYEVVKVERKGASYSYSGQREGKAVSGAVPTKGPLSSWIGQLAGVRAVAKGERAEHRYLVVNDSDLPVASEVVLRREGNKLVKQEGEGRAEITVDASGAVSKSVRGDLELERLLARGTP